MSNRPMDQRSIEVRTRDERIAAEPRLAETELPQNAAPAPVDAHLRRLRHQPVAIAGIVESGVMRPLDPGVKLSEHSRVIIVAEAK
jgi:hypothetical protein